MATEALDFASILDPAAFLSGIDSMVAGLTGLSDAAAAASDSISASMDRAALSTRTMAASLDTAAGAAASDAGANDAVAASTDVATASTDANSAATDANTGKKDANALSSQKMSDAFGGLVMPIALAGAALIGIGVAAIDVGSKYQTAMSVVQGLTGATAAQMAGFNTQILAMAPAMGEAPTELAQGLYYVLSAGTPAVNAMAELKVVTEASAAGMVDAATDADALTSAMNSYGASANQAMHYQDMILEAVKDGKTTMNEFAAAIGKAAVTGNVAGYSFNQVAAAMSTMTLEGATARVSSNDLAFLMRDLGVTTDKVAASAQKMGLQFDESSFKTMSLQGQLQYLEQITGGNTLEMLKLTGGAAGFTAASMLMTNKGAAFNKILIDMGNSAGMTASAFQVHEATMGATWDKLKATVDVVLIDIFNALQPIVVGIMQHIMPALAAFGAWASTHGPQLAQIFIILAGIIGGALVGAIIGASMAITAAQLAAIGITAGIGLLVGAIMLLLLHWKDISNFLNATIIPVIRNVIDWFVQWKVPILAVAGVITAFFLPALIGLAAQAVTTGAVLVGQFIASVAETGLGMITMAATSIPPVIVGILSYAAATWVAVAANIALYWPIYLVIAAVAALIAIVVLVITHWKQVSAFFEGLWADIVSIWNDGVNAVVGFAQGLWKDVSGFFVGLWNDAKRIWNGLIADVKGIITGGFNLVKSIIQNAINFVVGLFSWMYNHNTYFKMLVDDIIALFTLVKIEIGVIWNGIMGFLQTEWKGIQVIAQVAWGLVQQYIVQPIQDAWAWLQQVWGDIKSFLQTEWKGIQVIASAAWKLIQTYIITPVQGAWNFIVGVFNNVKAWLVGVWTTIGNDARQLWTNFTNAISSTWSNVTGWIGSHIVTPITSTIQNLIGQALSWGKNLIQMFINGITSMIGNLKNTLGNIAGSIGSFLGFHSPPAEGDAADSDTWGPNFMTMFASGITANAGKVISAVAGVAKGAANALNGGLSATSGIGIAGGSGGTGYALAGGGSGGPTTVNVQMPDSFAAGIAMIDPQSRALLTKMIGQETANQARLQGRSAVSYTGKRV